MSPRKRKIRQKVALFHRTAELLNDQLASSERLSLPNRQFRRMTERTALSFPAPRQAPGKSLRVPKGTKLSGEALSLDQSMDELLVEGHLELKRLRLSEHQTVTIAQGGSLVCTDEIQCASVIVRGKLSAPVTTDQLALHETAQTNGLLQASSVQVVPGSLVNGQIKIVKEPRLAPTSAPISAVQGVDESHEHHRDVYVNDLDQTSGAIFDSFYLVS